MIDIVVRIDQIPESGADVLATEYRIATGGGYNAMSAAARQGMSAVYAGRLGRGPFSTIARVSFDDDHVEEPIEVDEDDDAGFCVAMIDDGGERTFITSPGAEGTLRSSDLSSLDVRSGDYVLVSGYNVMYDEAAPIVLEWIEHLDADVVVVFDPAIRVMDVPALNLRRILDRADWTLCNETEASSITGEASLDAAVVALGQMTGRRGVVVRHGASGCTVFVKNAAPVLVPGFDVTVVDTNGAGDIHSGVFIAEMSLGTDVIEAARRGNAAAALAISVLGPATCPAREVVTDMIGRAS